LPRSTFGLILAAGRGRRLGEGAPPEGKAFTPILGEPMLRWSVRAMDACPEVGAIVIVAPPGEEGRAREAAAGCDGKLAMVVAGGEERQGSLGAGLDALAALGEGDPLVAVHDAARALVRPEDVGRAVTAAERWGAAILAVPVKDTIKVVEKESWIRGTPDRATLWIAQTPQAARASLLGKALAHARAEGVRSTDEAALLEGIGVAVRVVLGDYANLKITTPDDILLAEAILRHRGVAP
jgi:2-C-methyl-D-erythritol 4-phosphate cytidylyltransferase